VQTHFEQRGFTIKQDIFGKYLRGMLATLQTPDNISLIQPAYMARLFSNAQIRKERAFTFSQLAQIANPGEHSQEFHTQMKTLVQRSIFKRGYRVQCEYCGLDHWYSLNESSKEICCMGCQQAITLSLEQHFAYKINPLWAEGLKNGVLTTMLTLFHFQRKHTQIEWDAGIIVEKDGKAAEIDLVIGASNECYLIECKDKITRPKDLISQLDGMRRIAEDLEAKAMLTTIGIEEVPESVQPYLHEHQIDCLTGNDLIVNS